MGKEEHNDSKNPMISIAMATYNGAKYLEEQIVSILRQTLAPSEIVVCDDCSTDGTWEILQRYANMDTRFKICRNDNNLGVVKNFEKAISLCSGDYIALSDQDDIWKENHLEVQYTNIGNKSMCCGNGLIVDKNNQSLGLTIRYQQGLDWVPRNDFLKAKSILFFRNPYFGATVLLHKSLVKLAIPIPNGCNYHDSWIAFAACMDKGIKYVDEIILNYRRTDENVTNIYNTRYSKYQIWRSCYFPEDRLFMINEIYRRKETLSIKKQVKFRIYKFTMKKRIELEKKQRFERRVGKLLCMLFLLLNCRSIYSFRIFHGRI